MSEVTPTATPQHTPTPWKIGKEFEVRDQKQKVIPIEVEAANCGRCGGPWLIGWLFTKSLPLTQQRANARLIVKAVNSFQPLVEALDLLVEACLDPSVPKNCRAMRDIVKDAEKVLTLVREGRNEPSTTKGSGSCHWQC
jgi:hypothetical protein